MSLIFKIKGGSELCLCTTINNNVLCCFDILVFSVKIWQHESLSL